MNDFDLFCLRNSICTVVLFNFFALWITSESVQNSFRDLRVISHITTLYMTYSSQMSFIFNGRFLFCFLCLLVVPFSLLLSRSPSLCLFLHSVMCMCVCMVASLFYISEDMPFSWCCWQTSKKLCLRTGSAAPPLPDHILVVYILSSIAFISSSTKLTALSDSLIACLEFTGFWFKLRLPACLFTHLLKMYPSLHPHRKQPCSSCCC